ncbi:MAG: ABC transporter substrate-binding protein [Alphaproteobacteria bacterium]|nr:ABC transporter substrate-binding protein [Alphaproteobacteria bacterium]
MAFQKKLALGLGLLFFGETDLYAAHGIAMGASPHYPADFKHFSYVNPDAPKGGVLHLASAGTFDSFNPFVIKGNPAAGLTSIHPSYLHATLMVHSYDEPMGAYGYLAEDVEVAPDNSAVTFRLRREATFHDGTPIRAEDVVWSFNTLRAKGQPLYGAYYADVAKAEALDAHTVRFTFKVTTNRELPIILGELPILSKAYFSKHPFEDANLIPPVGSGPYKITAFQPGHSVTYERVKGWWGADLPVCKGQNNFDKIIFEYYKDQTVVFEAFKKGSYDLRLENVAANWATGYNIPAVKEGKIKKLELSFENPQAMNILTFNTRKGIFADARVREALTYAYNFEWVNKTLFYGLYERLHSYFSGSPLAAVGVPQGAELALLKRYEKELPGRLFKEPFTLPVIKDKAQERASLERSKSLLQEAGFVIKNGALLDPGTQKPVVLEILLAQENIVKSLQNFIHNMEKLGIKTTLRIVDAAQYEARLGKFDFDMIYSVIPQFISPGNEQREFWSSSRADLVGARNYAGIKNPVVDALVEDIQKAPTRQDLEVAVRALDRVLLWNFYGIPLYTSPKTRIAYWNKIVPPQTFAKYGLSLDAWWSADAKGEKS